MNLKQTATVVTTVVTTGGAIAAWIAGSVLPSHAPQPVAVVERAPIDVRSAALATEVARLHEHLRPFAAPRQPSRDLFRFGAPAHRATEAPAVLAAPVVAVPPAPPAIAMKLVGMAEDPGPDGPTRIAFINVEGQLFSVKETDSILDKYRVTKISADVVELTDTVDGTVRRLALR